MWPRRRAKAAKICAYAVGVGMLIMLVLATPTALTLSLAVLLVPFTLAMSLRLTASLACDVLSLMLGDCRDRAELVASAIGAIQPPSEGEQYQETMVNTIRDPDASPELVRKMCIDLLKTAPSTILEAWMRVLRPRRRVRAH
ncbi:MAG: hypothetical protein JO115_07740 [Pseudonocardiales bacterium]|nr:hypothetical protein [Pseudonocardiales bacterium]